MTAVSINPKVIRKGKSILQCSLQYPSFARAMAPELHVQFSNLGSYIYTYITNKHMIHVICKCQYGLNGQCKSVIISGADDIMYINHSNNCNPRKINYHTKMVSLYRSQHKYRHSNKKRS